MNEPTLSKQAVKCLKHLQAMDKAHGGFHDLSDFEHFMVASLERKDLIQQSRGAYRITGRGRKAIKNHKRRVSSYDRLRQKVTREQMTDAQVALVRRKLNAIKTMMAEIETILNEHEQDDQRLA